MSEASIYNMSLPDLRDHRANLGVLTAAIRNVLSHHENTVGVDELYQAKGGLRGALDDIRHHQRDVDRLIKHEEDNGEHS